MKTMNKILLLFILIIFWCNHLSYTTGVTVDDLIKDYNKKFGATWFNCSEVSEDFYNAIDQNMQKANLQCIAIKTGKSNPITKKDGHRIVTYTEGRTRYVITTWSRDNIHFEVKKLNMGTKTLHEICMFFIPNYTYIKEYKKGFGFIPKSRTLLMNECGHKVDELDDIWSRSGKKEISARTLNTF